jgi:hypothetical protein
LVGYYFLVVFPTQRNSTLTLSGNYIDRNLWYRSHGQFADWVTSVSSEPGMAWVKLLANSSQYFSGPLHTLDFFVTQTDVFSWYKLGLYNISQISQVAGAFSKDITPWQQIRFDITSVLGFARKSGNPWSTGIRDLGIDFGLLTVLVIGILGFVAQALYVKCARSGSYVGLVAATYISASCLIFAFISPFQIRVISNGFWLIGLIALAGYLLSPSAPPSEHGGRTSPRTEAMVGGQGSPAKSGITPDSEKR